MNRSRCRLGCGLGWDQGTVYSQGKGQFWGCSPPSKCIRLHKQQTTPQHGAVRLVRWASGPMRSFRMDRGDKCPAMQPFVTFLTTCFILRNARYIKFWFASLSTNVSHRIELCRIISNCIVPSKVVFHRFMMASWLEDLYECLLYATK